MKTSTCVSKSGGCLRITIPKKYVDYFGVKKRHTFLWKNYKGKLIATLEK